MKEIAVAIAAGICVAGCSGSEAPSVEGRPDCSKLLLRHEAIPLRDAEIDQAVAGHEIDSPELRQGVAVPLHLLDGRKTWLVQGPADVDDGDLRLAIERLPIDWEAESVLLADPYAAAGTRRFAIRGSTLEIHLATERPCLEPEQNPGLVGASVGFGQWIAIRVQKTVTGARILEHVASYRVPRPEPEGLCEIVEAQHSIRRGWHAVMKDGSGYRMWVQSWRSGCSGTGSQCSDLFFTDSPDGIGWNLDPAEDHRLEFDDGVGPANSWTPPAIVRDDSGGFLMLHFSGSEIHSSRSDDGIRWTGGGKVLERFDAALGLPLWGRALGAVSHAGGVWLWIEARNDSDLVSRIYLARSEDDGQTWSLVGDAPVLSEGAPGSFDELGVGDPQVFRKDGKFVMVYQARSGGGSPLVPLYRVLAIAESDDGVHWMKRDRPLPIPGTASVYEYVDSPSVVDEPDQLLVWFAEAQGSIYRSSCPW